MYFRVLSHLHMAQCKNVSENRIVFRSLILVPAQLSLLLARNPTLVKHQAQSHDILRAHTFLLSLSQDFSVNSCHTSQLSCVLDTYYSGDCPHSMRACSQRSSQILLLSSWGPGMWGGLCQPSSRWTTSEAQYGYNQHTQIISDRC